MSLGITVSFVAALSALTVDTANGLEEAKKNNLSPYLGKRYELYYNDDKFDDVMKALGVGLIMRNLGKLVKPTMELTEKDGKYTLSYVSSIQNYSVSFKIGEEFQHLTPDERIVQCKFTQDANKLIQVEEGDKTTVAEREFSDDEVVITTKVDDIVSVRKYKRLL